MKRTMVLFIAATGIAMAISCNTGKKEEAGKEEKTASTQPAAMTPEQMVERGEYLVNSMACEDCHTPKLLGPNGPTPDMERRFGGHPADIKLAPVDLAVLKDYVLFNQHNTAVIGPWGASFAANISSDPTGIGNWQEENFITAIREGKNKGMMNGRTLLPPMPWQYFKNLNDDDLKAIFAYLKTTKPVSNLVPAPIPLDELKKSGMNK